MWKGLGLTTNERLCAMLMRIILTSLLVLTITGCRLNPPEVRSFFAFPEFRTPKKGVSNYLFTQAQEIASKTDAFRQREIARFLLDNRIEKVTALFEYQRYIQGALTYTVIVITTTGVHQLDFTDPMMSISRLIISADMMFKIDKWIFSLDGFDADETGLDREGIILFVTRYKNNKPNSVFYTEWPWDHPEILVPPKRIQSRILQQICTAISLPCREHVETREAKTGFFDALTNQGEP